MVGHKFLGGAGWVVASTTLERWLRPRRRGEGVPPSSAVHRTRARWVGTCGVGFGVFRRCGGELLSGCPERSQRGTGGSHRSNFGLSASFSMLSPPWTPLFYGGCQLGSSCGSRKGAGGVGIDFSSPTAAAAWVGFPAWWFLCLRMRLCVRWGTSCAVVEGVVASTILERWLRRWRRGRGIPPSSAVHRIRAQWPGGSWDCPLKAPRAGMFLSMNRRIPP